MLKISLKNNVNTKTTVDQHWLRVKYVQRALCLQCYVFSACQNTIASPNAYKNYVHMLQCHTMREHQLNFS